MLTIGASRSERGIQRDRCTRQSWNWKTTKGAIVAIPLVICIFVASSNVVEGTVSSCDARKESQVASIMFKMQNILVFSIACTRTVVWYLLVGHVESSYTEVDWPPKRYGTSYDTGEGSFKLDGSFFERQNILVFSIACSCTSCWSAFTLCMIDWSKFKVVVVIYLLLQYYLVWYVQRMIFDVNSSSSIEMLSQFKHRSLSQQ